MLRIAVAVAALMILDDKVKDAAGKLADQANYTFSVSMKSAGGGGQGRFTPGPYEGKTEKGGFTVINVTQGDNSFVVVLKGDKVAIKTADGWKAAADLRGGQGRRDPTAGIARRFQSFKAPAAEAAQIAAQVGDLKEEDGALSGSLSEAGVKERLSRGGRPGGNPPQISDAKGTAKFWIKDGILAKYEYSVQGKMTFGNRDVDIDRTTSVEIKDVGSTKVEVPDEAKKLLE